MSPYAHSPAAVWPGVVDEVPAEFEEFVAEPAFSDNGVPRATLCLWRRRDDAKWRHGPVTFPSGADLDGADWLFEQLDGQPDTYRRFALDYYEKEIDLAAISHIYRQEPVSDRVVSALNPQLSLSDIAGDRHEIGYSAAQLGGHS